MKWTIDEVVVLEWISMTREYDSYIRKKKKSVVRKICSENNNTNRTNIDIE